MTLRRSSSLSKLRRPGRPISPTYCPPSVRRLSGRLLATSLIALAVANNFYGSARLDADRARRQQRRQEDAVGVGVTTAGGSSSSSAVVAGSSSSIGSSRTATVMGLALGYNLDVFQRFVGSLRHTGYSGTIILGVSNDVAPPIVRYLTHQNVTLKRIQFTRCTYPGAPGGDGRPIRGAKAKELGTCAIEYPDVKIRWGRFPLARDWLEECTSCTGPVLVCDVRDVYFQDDPFGSGSMKVEGLQVFQENPQHTSTDYYLVNPPIKKCKGVEFPDMPMLCSGSTIGTREAMLSYLGIMHEEMKVWQAESKCRTTLNGDDQGIHNYLYYAGKLPFAKPIPHRTGIVNTVGVDGMAAWSDLVKSYKEAGRTDGTRAYNGANSMTWIGQEYNVTDADGFFVNLDGTRSKMVHQYDRYGSPVEAWLKENSPL